MSQSVVVISPDELRSIVSDAVIAAVARAQLVSVSRKAILSEKEAAALLDVNPGTLKRSAVRGQGTGIHQGWERPVSPERYRPVSRADEGQHKG